MPTATRRRPWYSVLYIQVLIAIALGIALGYFYPKTGIAMKPLGDGFISLIKMMIAPVIFCTVVHGIASMRDLGKVGRVGLKALVYFELVSTLALAIGLGVGELIRPGAGFNIGSAIVPPGEARKSLATASDLYDALAEFQADRQTLVVADVAEDARYIFANPESRSEMAVPLIYRDTVIGVVNLESPRLAYFTEEHVRVFSTLAPQIAVAIENARLYERVLRSEARLERDLERAREIQMHLMPPLCPVIAGLEVCARFQPARELGGDLYEFLNYGRERHVLAVGEHELSGFEVP